MFRRIYKEIPISKEKKPTFQYPLKKIVELWNGSKIIEQVHGMEMVGVHFARGQWQESIA